MKNDQDLFEAVDDREQQSFTFRDLLSILFKHRRVIVFCFAVVTVLVALGMVVLPSTFIAEGKVLVKTEQQGNPSFFSGIAAYREPRDSDPVNRKIETEMELLATRQLSERVVQKLGLKYDQVYHKPLTHYLRPLADAYDWVKETVFGAAPDQDKYGFSGTVKEFNKSFTVEPLKSKSADTTSNLILVSVKAANAEVSRDALQALLEEYVLLTVEQNQKLGKEAYALVEQNMALAERDLLEARERQRKFLADKGASLSSRYAIPTSGAPKSAADGLSGAATLTAGEGSTVGALRGRLVDTELRLMEMRQEFTDKSENVKVLQSSLGDIKKRLDAELKNVAENEQTFSRLDLDVKAAEQHYVDLRRKLEQIGLFVKLNPAEASNRQIAEPPLLPKSSEWKKSLLVVILGAFGGLALGLGIAGYREYSDHRLTTPDAVRRFLGMPVLVVVSMHEESALKAALNPQSPVER